jgi:hypothetical protein
METKKLICCICGAYIEGYGNNPEGAMYYDLFNRLCTPTFKEDERCCDACNEAFVIPGRIYRLIKNTKGER